MQAMGAPYPATFTFDPPDKVANWRALFNWLLAIPHFIVLYILQIVSSVVAFVSWIVILFTGKMPEGLAGVQTMYIRYATRTYTYSAFMREEYPPFSFDTTPADPGDDPRVHVDIVPQLTDRNRLTVFFRILMIIPSVIVLFFLAIAAEVAFVIAFFAVLFTGRWPAGLRDYVLSVMRWGIRLQAYYFLLTDEYPPFQLS